MGSGRPYHTLFNRLLFSGGGTITVSRESAAFPKGCVLFTFDDGPNRHGETSARLLELLRKHDIKAYFALLGENAEYNPQLAREILGEGHIIINHGYGARFAVSLGDKDFTRNLTRGEDAINAALGTPLSPRYYRPQGGLYRKRHQFIWESLGYKMVPVTARAYDAVLKEKDKPLLIRRLVSSVEEQGGGVILLHDARDSHALMESKLEQDPQGVFNRSWIPGAVEELIDIFRKKGYRLNGFEWELPETARREKTYAPIILPTLSR
jgi:peptidoglycan/xylan/chitin deacetylase (PgdA/CDA1 family)